MESSQDKPQTKYVGHSPQLGVRVDVGTNERIQEITVESGRSTSDVLRRLIRLGLESESDEAVGRV